MQDGSDGQEIARQRIAAVAAQQGDRLELGRLGLSEPPAELFRLRGLRALSLGDGFRGEEEGKAPVVAAGRPNAVLNWLARLAELPELEELSLAGLDFADLAQLRGLAKLRVLDCSRTEVADLAALRQLPSLLSFNCSGTPLRNLASLQGCASLQSLDCSATQITDLGPLTALTGLQRLNCADTEITDLAPLAALPTLRRLDCSGTRIEYLTGLRRATGLQRLSFARTRITEMAPLIGLAILQRLDCSDSQVSELSALARLRALRQLNVSGAPVANLAPLSALEGLQVLHCADTQVESLAPLAKVAALRALDCSNTQVADLSPLAGTPMLQILHCSGTQVADLKPLAALPALQVLYCSYTPIADLSPLTGLSELRVLSCVSTQLRDLSPLAKLPALQEFSCANTPVADLSPVSGLPALQWLSCAATGVTNLAPLARVPTLQVLTVSDTAIADLAPLTELTGLRSLACSDTPINDLSPLAELPALQWLEVSNCRLETFPDILRGMPALRELYLDRTSLAGVPAEVLSQSRRDNCLAALRAHYADLAEGVEAVPDIKLIVLGNGRVGKTQLSRKLRGQVFQPDWDSTHGVEVNGGALQDSNLDLTARLQIWDFGGQDIYHGTHTLFLRTRAVFLIAWAKDVENTPEYTHQGITFRNHPLSYWAEYVRQFGDRNSPVLIMQTKCDAPADEAKTFPVSAEALDRFGYNKLLYFSSANDRGREQLDASLHDAIAWLRHPDRQGAAVTGAGRMRVRRRLEAMREEDAARPSDQRRYRTLEQGEFTRICTEEGGVGSVDHLLAFLDSSGVVFYRKGLFDNRVVLDQAWALDAIYAIFQRDKCYRQLQFLRGRFTRQLLELLVWRDYSPAEQRLFLSMMRSCGICFVHRPGAQADDDETEYVAPDLLPPRAAIEAELAARWEAALPEELETFTYTLLHPSLLRNLLARIGGQAQADGLYWRTGVLVYDTSLRSRAIIEQTETDDWGGQITVRAQGPNASALLNRLTDWIEDEHSRSGPRPEDVKRSAPKVVDPLDELLSMGSGDFSALQPQPVFGPAPVPGPACFISHASETEGLAEALSAGAAGVEMVRERTAEDQGQSLTDFLRCPGDGHHIVVLLDDAYLHSPVCMFELAELWQTGLKERDFLARRVRIYTLPDARIGTAQEREELGAYWRKRYGDLATMLRDLGVDTLEEGELRQLRWMGRFCQQVPQMLQAIAASAQPASAEQIRQGGLAGR